MVAACSALWLAAWCWVRRAWWCIWCSPEGFGYGDVKFGLLVGLGLGMLSPAAGVVVFLTASLLGVVSAWVRPWPVQRAAGADRRSVPFGPPLAIAAFGWVLLLVSTGGGLR